MESVVTFAPQPLPNGPRLSCGADPRRRPCRLRVARSSPGHKRQFLPEPGADSFKRLLGRGLGPDKLQLERLAGWKSTPPRKELAPLLTNALEFVVRDDAAVL